MKKILLVFTGGTIGSTAVNSTISPHKKQSHQLVNLFESAYPDSEHITFKSIQPVQLLSENLIPQIWETLIEAVEAEGISQYDGIIVTHGSDTLAFTAAALSMYFHAIKIPLLLVCSNYPLEHPSANGLSNFIAAVEFIRNRTETGATDLKRGSVGSEKFENSLCSNSSNLPEPTLPRLKSVAVTGVFVPYKNQGSPITQVHLGTRLASCFQLGNDFMSVQSNTYLNFEENNFYPLPPPPLGKCFHIPLKPNFSARILLIRPYPGLDYSHFSLDQVDVVLHDLYHSGTACSSRDLKDNYSFLTFIKKCNQSHVSIYMAPAVKGGDQYSGVKALIEQGVFMIWNMSLESAYAKLLLAYGNFDDIDAIHHFLEQTIAFEHVT